MIWTSAYGTDNTAYAKEGTKILNDKRVKHYWDSKTELSFAFGALKKLPRDAPLAYDVFYVYGSGILWDADIPPDPTDWMHQIIDDERYLQAHKMIAVLKKLLTSVKT